MRNLTHRWPQSGYFPRKLGHFFPIFKKGQGGPPPPPPLPPSSYALDRGHKFMTSTQNDRDPLPPTSSAKMNNRSIFWKQKNPQTRDKFFKSSPSPFHVEVTNVWSLSIKKLWNTLNKHRKFALSQQWRNPK